MIGTFDYKPVNEVHIRREAVEHWWRRVASLLALIFLELHRGLLMQLLERLELRVA